MDLTKRIGSNELGEPGVLFLERALFCRSVYASIPQENLEVNIDSGDQNDGYGIFGRILDRYLDKNPDGLVIS